MRIEIYKGVLVHYSDIFIIHVVSESARGLQECVDVGLNIDYTFTFIQTNNSELRHSVFPHQPDHQAFVAAQLVNGKAKRSHGESKCLIHKSDGNDVVRYVEALKGFVDGERITGRKRGRERERRRRTKKRKKKKQ